MEVEGFHHFLKFRYVHASTFPLVLGVADFKPAEPKVRKAGVWLMLLYTASLSPSPVSLRQMVFAA
jgi:hypothetical protein